MATTDQSPFAFTLREANQIKAALVFWRNAIRFSRNHPAHHPHAKEFFTQTGPLTMDEIDNVIDRMPAYPRELKTVPQIASELGITQKEIMAVILENRICSTFRFNSRELFQVDEIKAAIHG